MYFKQLDFLRFIAVTMVIMQHWFHFGTMMGVDLGRVGVLIFFTLSGFLITGILLDRKEHIEAGKSNLGAELKTFYIRRILRIAPIYYILLLFLFVFSYEEIRTKFWWYFLYGSNIYTYIHQSWDGLIGPLWSLAVEEQFYLFWPFVILGLPKKYISVFLKFCILFGPVLRLGSVLLAELIFTKADYKISGLVLMPSCIDCFAWGGLLAYSKKNAVQLNLGLLNLKTFSVVVLVTIVTIKINPSVSVELFYPTVLSIFSVFIIHYLVIGITGIGEYIVGNSFLLYLGKISYGMYLYHGPFPLIMGTLDFILSKLKVPFLLYDSFLNQPAFIKGVVFIFYLLVICTVSYFLIEKPFNRLKDHFIYARK